MSSDRSFDSFIQQVRPNGTKGLERIRLTALLANPEQQKHFTENNFVYVPDDAILRNIRIVYHGQLSNIRDCHLVLLSGLGNLRLAVGHSNTFVYIGHQVRCSKTDVMLWRDPTLIIRDMTTINAMKVIVDNADVEIDADCMFSDEILLQSNDQHAIIDIESGSLLNGGRRRIKIDRHAWVGRRALIMPDVSIGEGAVIGAGSVVTQDVPAFCVAAGIPARVVRKNTSWGRNPGALTRSENAFFRSHGLDLSQVFKR